MKPTWDDRPDENAPNPNEALLTHKNGTEACLEKRPDIF